MSMPEFPAFTQAPGDSFADRFNAATTKADEIVAVANQNIEAIATALNTAIELSPAPAVFNPAAIPTTPVANNIVATEIQPVELHLDFPAWEPPQVEQVVPAATPAAPNRDLSVTLPDTPDLALPEAPPEPGNFDLTLSLPSLPDLSTSATPDITTLVVPSVPTINLPTLESLVPPTFVEPTYLPVEVPDPVIDTSAVQRFLNTIVLPTESNWMPVTKGIYDLENARLVDEIDAKATADIDALYEDLASRGFMSPTGATIKRADLVRSTAAAQGLKAARETVIARAGHEMQAYSAQLGAGVDLAKQLVVKDIELHKLKIDVLTTDAKLKIETYNAAIALYRAKQEDVRAKIDIFKAQVDAELSKLEIFKGEIEAQKAIGQLDIAKLEAYKAKITAVQVRGEVYSTQVRAEATRLEAVAKQIDIYRSRVEAYTSVVNSVKVKGEVYETQLEAALAPLKIYQSAVEGYRAEVAAYSATEQVKTSNQQAAVANLDAYTKAFNAQAQAYGTDLQAQVEQLRARISHDVTRIEGIKAGNSQTFAAFEGALATHRATTQAQTADFQGRIELWKAQSEIAAQKANLAVEAARGAATVSGSLAASALSGVNISTGFSMSESNGRSWSYSHSDSHQVTE